MKIISLASFGIALFTALAAATPVEPNTVEARAEQGVLIKYDGKCSKKDNSCKFKGQGGKTTFCHCKFKKVFLPPSDIVDL
ncbi:hypothetical protein MW887_006279 [Aspergillus wentii]|nr:hypothetical protein MW887_006279 [Aspergillus wentii]